MIIVMICKYFPQCFIETACRAQYHRVGPIYMQELSTIKLSDHSDRDKE